MKKEKYDRILAFLTEFHGAGSDIDDVSVDNRCYESFGMSFMEMMEEMEAVSENHARFY